MRVWLPGCPEMYKIKVLGAGSIGNHLSHAARSLGWQVTICDVDEAALERTRNEIYPGRYGAWDDAIELYPVKDAPKSVYDLIVIGTPPDAHIDLTIEAITEGPRAVLVEKPVCGPDLARAQEMFDLAFNFDALLVMTGSTPARPWFDPGAILRR